MSCVERSRWSYDSPKFKTAPKIVDPEMRAAKAASLREDAEGMVSETQSKNWDLINQEMTSSNVFCSTEDYNVVLESKKQEPVTGNRFHPGKNYNGLAIFDGRRLVSFDIFGNREVYQYYFDELSQDALGRVGQGTGNIAMKKAEAFKSKLDSPVTRENGNIGEFRWSGDQDFPGFELSFENNPVHMVGFSR